MRRVGFELGLFGQARSDRESVLMMRRLVWIHQNFRWHNPDVLRRTILDV
jgi:hypothetical protein